MKKNFIYLQGIIALGLLISNTSCVDDNESDSVRSVREAYANQLKAQAELLKTQAETDKVRQEAEVALIKAQTEQAKAQTKLNEANVALINAQTEIEKKKAEYEQQIAEEELKRLKVQAQLEMEESKYKLEQLKITSEIQMLNLQAELDKAKNQKDEILTQAISEYKVLIYEINTLKASIAANELQVIYEQAVMEDLKAINKAETEFAVKYYTELIVTTEAQITQAKQDVKNWEAILKTAGGDNLKKKIDEATLAYKALLVERSGVYATYKLALDKFEGGVRYDLVNFQSLLGKGYTGNAFPNNRTFYTLEEITQQIKSCTASVSNYQKKISDNNTKIDALKASLPGLTEKKETARSAMYAAEEEYNKANNAYWNNSTTENWNKRDAASKKCDEARSAYYDLYYKYDETTSSIYRLESENSDYIYNLSRENQNLVLYNQRKDAYAGDPDKGQKMIATYIKEKEVYDAAYKVYTDFETKVAASGEYLNKLNTIYVSYELLGSKWNDMVATSYEYIQSVINDLNTSIARKEVQLVKYKKDITNVSELNKKAVAEMTLRIENLKNTIEANKAELILSQKQADAAKVIIDQRMK